MSIIDILKEACNLIYNKIRLLVVTRQGNEKLGRGAGGDISRRIDVVAEAAVVEIFKKHNFKPTIIAEESGTIEGNDDGFLIMDAIDGTTNTSRAIPFYCCSLAYATNVKLSSVVASAVIDLPRGELYHASDQRGAFMNNTQIHVSKSFQFAESNNHGFLIMDAIDGTTNTSRAIPFYCCSLAYATNVKLSSVVASAVIDLPRGELYHASDQRGAFMNNTQIHVSKSFQFAESNNLDDILVGLNLSGASPENIMRLLNVISNTNHIRHFGANALELCFLA